FLSRAPGFEELLLSIKPGFFVGAFGELRGHAGLDFSGKRFVPLESGPGGIGDRTELEALGQGPGNVGAMKASGLTGGRLVEWKLALFGAVGRKEVVVDPGEGDVGPDSLADALDHRLHRKLLVRASRVIDADDVALEAVDDPVGKIADVDELDGVGGVARNNHYTAKRGADRPVNKTPRSVARADDEAGP